MPGENLLKASAFLRCEKKSHHDCSDLLKSVRLVGNVNYAETTNAIINKQEYCVSAEALVDSKRLTDFKGVLESIKNVEKVAIFYSLVQKN